MHDSVYRHSVHYNEDMFPFKMLLFSKFNYSLFKHHEITQIRKPTKKEVGKLKALRNVFFSFPFVPLFELNLVQCTGSPQFVRILGESGTALSKKNLSNGY